jgi:hypothetical protein
VIDIQQQDEISLRQYEGILTAASDLKQGKAKVRLKKENPVRLFCKSEYVPG